MPNGRQKLGEHGYSSTDFPQPLASIGTLVKIRPGKNIPIQKN